MAEPIPDVNSIKAKALQTFAEKFSEQADVCVYAPGRVNLIGEHTDYNEGFVLPMALPMVTVIAGKSHGGKKTRILSLNDVVGATNEFEFEAGSRANIKPGEPKWANYVKGCIANFICDVPAFNAVIISTVPAGAGLSSSAALEVATYTFLETLSGRKPKKPEQKALACQKAEHEFAGVPCGIMDQFISVMGQEGCALLLDCRDLNTKQIPMLHIDNYIFLITNSNAPHKLSSSAYCERRDCCYEAAKILGKKSLRDANINDIRALISQNASDRIVKRARHVITEIQRTLDAAVALEKGDFQQFGRLMNESHDSLRDDYEVSSEELDTLVSAAREVDGVLGSRLTGAGFGGCTVTLLKKDTVNKAIQHMKAKYPGTPAFYIATPAGGARKIGVN
ncbi:galactokinase-like [Pogonomyrmex barbatus]|uniref:galactokinase-like n=1 Tax=Pogonomyrmex barbatus TaxID=144034 RepID=A0A6I9WH34_9HYME|nr:galactokinase-like [Pogonomyrmex barbatus]XP_011641988.1 galactokinase-like [Pogonomyrmex barbatus]XP_025074867.1 galactokinase-like [Pogonomyrmex barbatus]XP_025074868.1 galactokinase-like [Pogonomyrmex barbatus]XP_025074869.1 galactokinase-like [Pogonomyrmex barbatus]